MDNYIPMCREATEIQELWGRDNGDFYYSVEADTEYIYLTLPSRDGAQFKDIFWLPRIEDLMGMLDLPSDYAKITMLINFIKVSAEKNDSLTAQEWLLRLVMEYNYNKTWNGATFNE